MGREKHIGSVSRHKKDALHCGHVESRDLNRFTASYCCLEYVLSLKTNSHDVPVNTQ